MDFSKLLFTGGTGLLGKEMRKLLPEAVFVSSADFDVSNYAQMARYLEQKEIDIIFHAAAFTSPPKVDNNPNHAINVNILGTCNVVKLCMEHDIKLIYVSTDYVFKGDKGMYKEDDPVFPVNKYAWSKLGGECAVRMYDKSLIIRTSFGPNEFPYEKAFIDQWTTRLPVSEVAIRFVECIKKDVFGTLNIGGKRQTVMEYAKMISPKKNVGELSLQEVAFVAPKDTSLDTSKYIDLFCC